MLRHLTSFCIVLCLSAASIRAQDQLLPDDKIPAEVRQLQGKVVKIYHNVDLLGAGKPSPLHTEYLTIVLRQAGVTVQQSRSLEGDKKTKDEPKPPDLVIFGDMQPLPQLAPKEAADPFVARKMRNMQIDFDNYVEARPKLEADAAAAGERVIKSEDLVGALGIRVTEAEITDALNERARQWLKREIPVFKADALGLSDIIDFLRDVSEANIFVNWRALEAAGIDRKAPLTLRLEKLSLSEALHELLTQAAGGDEGKFGYGIDKGIIVISTSGEVKKLEQQSGQ